MSRFVQSFTQVVEHVNKIVHRGASFGVPILSRVKLRRNVLEDPLGQERFKYSCEDWGEGDWSELVKRVNVPFFRNWRNCCCLPTTGKDSIMKASIEQVSEVVLIHQQTLINCAGRSEGWLAFDGFNPLRAFRPCSANISGGAVSAGKYEGRHSSFSGGSWLQILAK